MLVALLQACGARHERRRHRHWYTRSHVRWYIRGGESGGLSVATIARPDTAFDRRHRPDWTADERTFANGRFDERPL